MIHANGGKMGRNVMAVRQGFEPWELFTLVGFQDRCFRPLSHLTASDPIKINAWIELFHSLTICKLRTGPSPSGSLTFLTDQATLALRSGWHTDGR